MHKQMIEMTNLYKTVILLVLMAVFVPLVSAQDTPLSLTIEIPAEDDLTQVSEALWSPDGTQLLVTYTDGIGVWDADTGEERLQLDVSGRGWWAADGASIITHDMTANEITRWDIASGAALYSVPNRDPLEIVSPDAARLLTTDGGTVTVRDAESGDILHTLDDLLLDWTWIGANEIAATAGDQFQHWDVRAGQQLSAFAFEGRTGDISTAWLFTVQRNPDESRMNLYDVATGELAREYRLTADVAQIQIGPGDETLYVVSRSAEGDAVIVWDIDAGEGRRLPVSGDAPRRALVARPAPDNEHLLTISYALDADSGQLLPDSGRLSVWDTASSTMIVQRALPGMVDGQWTADGAHVLVWGEAGGVLIRVPGDETRLQFDGATRGAALNADGRLAAWGGQQVRVWDVPGAD